MIQTTEDWDVNELNSVLLPTIPLEPVTQEDTGEDWQQERAQAAAEGAGSQAV